VVHHNLVLVAVNILYSLSVDLGLATTVNIQSGPHLSLNGWIFEYFAVNGFFLQ